MAKTNSYQRAKARVKELEEQLELSESNKQRLKEQDIIIKREMYAYKESNQQLRSKLTESTENLNKLFDELQIQIEENSRLNCECEFRIKKLSDILINRNNEMAKKDKLINSLKLTSTDNSVLKIEISKRNKVIRNYVVFSLALIAIILFLLTQI